MNGDGCNKSVHTGKYFMITPGDVDDRTPLEYNAFVDFIYGKLVGDKGCIGKNLFQRLFVNGVQLITKLKSNMKGTLMTVSAWNLTYSAPFFYYLSP